MLKDEEISERNGLLINFISSLDLGIHIIDLPHKPILLSFDYSVILSAYVKNFHLLLMKGDTQDIYLDIRLKPIRNMDLEFLKPKILEWFVLYQHNKIYTLKLKNTNLFIVGFNHHNKILKKNPYPVFAYFDPLIYRDLTKVEDVYDRFKKYYDLVIC
jgi:hypothetical protein